MHPITHNIVDLFESRGSSQYGREAVTQLQHALQAAWLADRQGAAPALVCAALLHDVGHLLHDLPDDSPDHGLDDRHEVLGQEWLERWFPPAVTEPVRLHVEAKRYLCAVDPAYLGLLSEPSRVSLQLQGGVMSERQVQDFEATEFAQDAVALRKWDDRAKDPDFQTPDIRYFTTHLDHVLEAQARA